MDGKYKTEVEYIVASQRSSDVSQDELVAILADILVEGFLSQLKEKQEESIKLTMKKKVKEVIPQKFYY